MQQREEKTAAELAASGGFRIAEAAYFFHALYFAARFYNRFIGSERRQTQMAAPRRTLPHRVLGEEIKAVIRAHDGDPVDEPTLAPAESSSHTIGMRWRSTISRRRVTFCSLTWPMEPAMTVKS